ncbi:MAG: NUDIX domain-containing protein [Candidatus Nomurabacteria bacterium]|nr:NUDIX domain-containing protein [Candidatus Nomurabacteria bacterium]
MKKLIHTQKNLDWITYPNIVATYISDELPKDYKPTAVYGFVFKNGKLLMTDLKEGERPTRRLDIPGGHLDQGESPEQSCIREIQEETGVLVSIVRPIAYCELTLTIPKPENYRYPYPTSYMFFYLCEILSEETFEGNESTHGRVWLAPEDFDKSEWCKENKLLIEEVMKAI